MQFRCGLEDEEERLFKEDEEDVGEDRFIQS